MEDFVKALTHVHSETDVSNQWQRAVKSLAFMSNMDIAVAWLHLSKYALHRGDINTVSEIKTIYKRALREYEQRDADDTQHDIHFTRQSNAVLSTDQNKLSNDIKDLKTIISAFHARTAEPAIDEPSSPDDTFSSSSSARLSDPTPSRSRSAPASSRRNDTGIVNGHFGISNAALQEMLDRCCKENLKGSEKIEKAVQEVKTDIANIKEQLDGFIATHNPIMTGVAQKQTEIIKAVDLLQTQLASIDPGERLARIEANSRAQGERITESIGAAITGPIQIKLDIINGNMTNEFEKQTTAILNHDTKIIDVVETTEATLNAILRITESMASTTSNAINLKTDVNNKIESLSELHKTTSKTLTGTVSDAFKIITELLTTLLDLNKETRANIKRLTVSDNAATRRTTGVNASKRPAQAAASPVSKPVWSSSDDTASSEEDAGPPLNQPADTDSRAIEIRPDTVTVTGVGPAATRQGRAVRINPPGNRPMKSKDNPLAEDPRPINRGRVSNPVEASEQAKSPGRPP